MRALIIAFMFFGLINKGNAYAWQAESVTPNSQTQLKGYEIVLFNSVLDGNTLIASGRKIRLWGINAPEKGENLFEISSKALELYIQDKILRCKSIDFDTDEQEVMHCYSGRVDLGALMVKSGFAEDYKEHSDGFYSREERFAQGANLGIWRQETDN